MTRAGTFLAAVLATIGRPGWWLMALATFLLRGGIVIVILPILTLPSPLALSNAFAPVLLPLALGRIEPAIILGPAALVVALLLWLVVGGRLAAAIDVAFVLDAAAVAVEEGVSDAPEARVSGRRAFMLGWRVLAIRLIAWLPLALAVGLGVARIVEVTYVELTRPVDVVTPLVVRVAGQVVNVLGLIVVAWVVGEIIGGVATRHVTLTRSGHGDSIAWAILTAAARPLSWLTPWLVTTALLVVVMGLTLAASAFAWGRAVAALTDRLASPLTAVLTLLIFVALWLAAMLLGGVVLAVRSSSQTFEHVRRAASARIAQASDGSRSGPAGAGTFGASAGGRPGDWSANDDGGSL